jgi:hypothetical protein
MSNTNTCPRCLHFIPNDATPGAYPGALSRTDNLTEVCSQCGTEEALEQFVSGGKLRPQTLWPVVRNEQLAKAFSSFDVLDDETVTVSYE